jgi:hypothetical protein
MSESLAAAETRTAESSLWDRAPGWRNLVVAASALTLAALAIPVLVPEEEVLPLPQPAPALEAVSATPSVTLSPLPVQPRVAAAPRAASPAPMPACALSLPTEARPMGTGVVVRYIPPLQAERRALANQQSLRAPISPLYAQTPRLVVRMDGADAGGGGQIVVVPPGMAVQIGDRVAFNAIRRDPVTPCSYIPPLVTGDSGPAAAAAEETHPANPSP